MNVIGVRPLDSARSAGVTCAFLFLAAVGVPGCVVAAVAAGAAAVAAVGTVIWVNGELQSQEEVPLDAAWDATLATLDHFELKPTEKSKDGLQGRAFARGADGTSYTIRLERISDTQTEVGIRVGAIGDRAKSELVLAKLREHLGK